MAKLLTLRCPECNGTWDWLRHPSDEPLPDRCELCNAWMGDGPEIAPVLRLKIRTERNKVPDQVYRKMESASHARAEEAAEMTGASASDMTGIRITDMKDNQREGDFAARAVASAQQLSTSMAKPEMQNPTAAQWASETTSGPVALSTRKVMDAMPHKQLIAQSTRAGNDGKRY